MGSDRDRSGLDDSVTVHAARKLGRTVFNTGKRRIERLQQDTEERLQTYQEDPEALEADLEALAEEGTRVGQDMARRAHRIGEAVSDGTARQLGWRDAREMVQAYGADSPTVEAYEEIAPGDLQEVAERIDFEPFDGEAFEPFQTTPLHGLVDDPLSYAVGARSEAYLRAEGKDVEGVFVEYTTEADTLHDINEETTVQVDFYTVV